MRLRGPREMLASRPQSEAELTATARRVPGADRLPGATVVAYVNWGRWVADCPCHASVAVHPEWATTGCIECGRVLTVTVPGNFRDIEDALLERSDDAQRQWDPSKTVESLRADTAEMVERIRERKGG